MDKRVAPAKWQTYLEKTTQWSHSSARTITLFPLKALPENPVKVQPARTPTTSMSFLISTMMMMMRVMVVMMVVVVTCIPSQSSSSGTCVGPRATQDSNPRSILN